MIDNRIYHSQQPIIPLDKSNNNSTKCIISKTSDSKAAFNQVLFQELSGVKLSQHAADRLHSRNIKLDKVELEKLNTAVEKATQKGSKEALILMNNNLALVVSVKNKTVITAIDGASIKNNVFTNIDSAVIV